MECKGLLFFTTFVSRQSVGGNISLSINPGLAFYPITCFKLMKSVTGRMKLLKNGSGGLWKHKVFPVSS